MSISSFLSRVLPVAVATAAGGPIAGASTAYQVESQKRTEQRIKDNRNRIIAENERIKNMDPYLQSYSGGVSTQAPIVRPTTANAGFGAGFGEFLGDVGRNIVSPFANLASVVAPFFGGSSVQQPAVTTTRSAGGQETQQSGTITQAGFGAALPSIISAGRNLIRSPLGQIGLGTAAGGAISMIPSGSSGMRITRKMKSQARMVLNMVNGDLAAASQILGIDQNMLVMILLKRFRNDGPVVTKAALRKTKQTVRRLKSMCDMYDSLRPTATRRRTPMKRATSTTLIKN
jgi:hypothetical protein